MFLMNLQLVYIREITIILIDTLYRLRDLGNTVIIVEHDEDVIRNSDWIIDIGPAAGIHGGK